MCFDHIHPLQHFPDLPPFLIHQLCSYKKKSRPICSPQIFLDVGHSTGDGLTYQALLVEKTDSLSQLVTTVHSSTAKGGISGPTPLSMLGFGTAWACTGLVHAIITSGSSHLQLLCFAQKTLLPHSHPPPLAPTLSTPAFHNRDEERGDRRVP